MARTPKLLTRPYWVVYLGLLGALGGFGLLWDAGAGAEWTFAFYLLVGPIAFLGVIVVLPSKMRPRPMCYGAYAAVNLSLFAFALTVLMILSIQAGPGVTWPGAISGEDDTYSLAGTTVYYASVLCYGMSGLLAAREAWHTRWRARVQRGEEHG